MADKQFLTAIAQTPSTTDGHSREESCNFALGGCLGLVEQSLVLFNLLPIALGMQLFMKRRRGLAALLNFLLVRRFRNRAADGLQIGGEQFADIFDVRSHDARCV